MAMTAVERDTHRYIYEYLLDEGYAPYAAIFKNIDLHLTDAKDVVGYMVPDKGYIVINKNLEDNQFSVIIRHEILHFALQHEARLLKHLCDSYGYDYDELISNNLKQIKLSPDDPERLKPNMLSDRYNNLRKELYKNKNFNIAGDYEISNRGYTEEDKKTVQAIRLNGKVLKGLVTESDHPEWVDLSIEDMYDELIKEMKKQLPPPQPANNDEQRPDKNQPPQNKKIIKGYMLDPKGFLTAKGKYIQLN